MPKIKTRETHRDIKVLDKTSVAGERMKNAFIRTRNAAANLMDDEQSTPEEYAQDKMYHSAEDMARDTGHTVTEQGKKLVRKGRDAFHEHLREPMQGSESQSQTAPPKTEIVPQSHSTSALEISRYEVPAASHEAPACHYSGYNYAVKSDKTIKTRGAKPYDREMPRQAAPTERGREYVREKARAKQGEAKAMRAGDNPFPRSVVHPQGGSSVAENPTYRAPRIRQAQQVTQTAERRQIRNSIKTAEKTAKFSQKAVKTAEQTSKAAIKTAQATAKTAQKSSQAAAKTARASAQAAHATAKAAATTAKAVAKAIITAVKAIGAAVKELIAAIAAGGWVAVIVIVVICLIGLIVASPFGIFFAGNNKDTDTVPVSAAVSQANFDFNSQLETLQAGDYDYIDVTGSMADWPEVLAVFAVKVAGSEDVDAMDVATMDPIRVAKLKEVFWDMNTLTSTVETIDHPDSDPDDEVDDSWTESILHITITAKTAEDMKAKYRFTEKQKTVLDELLENRDALLDLIGNLMFISADAETVIRNLPSDLSDERKAIVKTACSLVGKVTYFWGGKSLVIGWDSRWGTVQKVWAHGSETTGTYRPYGLDCSGFVDWVFYNATDGAYYPGHGGGAASQHTYCTAISWDEATPGDLVFYPDDSHVGIVGGRDENDNLLIIHCASGYNGAVITGANGFTSAGRPMFFS